MTLAVAPRPRCAAARAGGPGRGGRGPLAALAGTAVACAVVACTAVACNGDDGDEDRARAVSVGPRAGSDASGRDGGSGFVPRPSSASGGTPSGKGTLDDLDEDALTALCDELEARFAARVDDEQAARFACALAGLSAGVGAGDDGEAAFDARACESSTQRCASEVVSEVRAVDCEALALGVIGCERSVEQLTACFDAETAAVAVAIDPVSCSIATLEDVDALLAGLVASSLPECKAIADECPLLLPGAGPSSGSAPAFDGCADTCESARDGRCDDGGDRSEADTCVFGSDCRDCGPR